jgi:hypothetical protein
MLAYNSILTYSPPHVMGDCNINIAISRIFKEMLLGYKHYIHNTSFPKDDQPPLFREAAIHYKAYLISQILLQGLASIYPRYPNGSIWNL